jgi:hypothetical protein
VRRLNWRPLRPETLVLFAGAICYAAAVLLFAPAFFTTIVPTVNAAYDGYEVPHLAQLTKPFVVLWASTLFILWSQRSHISSLTVASTIAAFAFCAAYFIQATGWPYHAIAVSALLFFAVATLLPYRLAASAVSSTLLIIYLLTSVYFSIAFGLYRNPGEVEVTELLGGSKPGTVAVALTGNPSRIWPMVENARLIWPSRYVSFWMMNAMHAHEKEDGTLAPELADLADSVRRPPGDSCFHHYPRLTLSRAAQLPIWWKGAKAEGACNHMAFAHGPVRRRCSVFAPLHPDCFSLFSFSYI